MAPVTPPNRLQLGNLASPVGGREIWGWLAGEDRPHSHTRVPSLWTEFPAPPPPQALLIQEGMSVSLLCISHLTPNRILVLFRDVHFKWMNDSDIANRGIFPLNVMSFLTLREKCLVFAAKIALEIYFFPSRKQRDMEVLHCLWGATDFQKVSRGESPFVKSANSSRTAF